MLTNCVNCGAPLHGSKCEYCGTEYPENSDSEKPNLEMLDVSSCDDKSKVLIDIAKHQHVEASKNTNFETLNIRALSDKQRIETFGNAMLLSPSHSNAENILKIFN